MPEPIQTLELGPRHPATSFLLRLAIMAFVGAIADVALPDSQFKSIVILGCVLIGAIWLYLEASHVASVRLDIDAKARRLTLRRQFILRRTRHAFAFEDIGDIEIAWSRDPASIEAEVSAPDANSVDLVTKDGTRHVLLAPSHLNAVSAVSIRDFESAFRRAMRT